MLPSICPFPKKLSLIAKTVLSSKSLKVKRGSLFFISLLTCEAFVYGHTRAFPQGFRRLRLSYQALSEKALYTMCFLHTSQCFLLCPVYSMLCHKFHPRSLLSCFAFLYVANSEYFLSEIIFITICLADDSSVLG
jgi:hypothetical protein